MPIISNLYMALEALLGGLVGGIVGFLVYDKLDTPGHAYNYHPDDIAFHWGLFSFVATMCAADVLVRVWNTIRKKGGAEAVISDRYGGHIWFVPIWVIGGFFTWYLQR